MQAAEGRHRHNNGNGVPTQRILALVWALVTLWWSIFTPPEKTFATRVLLLQPAWAMRIGLGNDSWASDLFLTLVVHSAHSYTTGVWTFPSVRTLDLYDGVSQIYIVVVALLAICAISAGGIVHRGYQLEEQAVRGRSRKMPIEESLLPPLLMPSRTTHSRLFPQKHSFSYSYLYVGVPVGMAGRTSKALSIDGVPPAWFDVRADDYLEREKNGLNLAAKLQSYLQGQGVSSRNYSFAYLVTAPRCLGYSFNPVSFWYIYDADATLIYMILEVNNTFDERRMYLLKPGSNDDADNSEDGSVARGTTLFKETWPKDFHVSPFNSRKGSYSLRAVDPLASYEGSNRVMVDNTIVLRSSKDHPKIIARVFTTGDPIPAITITTFQLFRFVASWWWVGLVTFPRIAYQAFKLFFRRKLHVWFRPEVTPTSIGRAYTSEERDLEAIFREFLSHVVENSDRPLRVIYQSAHSHSEHVLYSAGYLRESEHEHTITIRVLSPAFYSRFIHYSHTKEAFDREALATDEKNRTLIIDPAHNLPDLLDAIKRATLSSTAQPVNNSSTALNSLRWPLLSHLRCPPLSPAYPPTLPIDPATASTSDIRAFPRSELDAFVQQHSDPASAATYRRICTRTFFAQRFLLGQTGLLTALDVLIRCALVLAAVVFVSRTDAFDVLRPREREDGDALKAAVGLAFANGIHVWSLVGF